ncbi:MAG: ABC transporter substrate-binding protein [Longimicrobiales bacterium]
MRSRTELGLGLGLGLRLGLGLALVAGCGDHARERDARATIEVTDHAGREVRLAGPASRVIALIPAATETVLALGAGDRLVARTDYDTQPELRSLPSVGGGLTPSVEWLIAHSPDLVIAWPDGESRDVVLRLEAAGIAVYGARLESVDAVLTAIRDVGALLGRAGRADALAVSISARLDSVRSRVADAPRPAVLYLLSWDPPFVAGPGSFIDELIRIAGGRNAFADASSGWPQVSLEAVVRRQPDVIIVPVEHEWAGAGAGALASLRGLPGWRDLDAVREGRVHEVDGALFNRPGPRIAETVRRLTDLLHLPSGGGP